MNGTIAVYGGSFDPPHVAQPADVRDVRRLRRPRRDRAEARHDKVDRAFRRLEHRCAVVEQPLEHPPLARSELALGLDEIAVFGADGAQIRIDLLQRSEQLGKAELRGRARPAELEDLEH